MSWIIIPVLIFILFYVLNAQYCTYDDQCNEGIIKCGFCENSNCYFPFPNIYISNKSCYFNYNQCNNSSCEFGQTKYPPLEGYSSCICECLTGFYGHQCEKKGNSSLTYLSGVQLIAPTVVNCLEDYSVFVTIQEQGRYLNNSVWNITLLLTTDFGGFGAIANEPTLKRTTTENAVAFCMKHSRDASICPFFQFNDANGMNLIFDIPLKVPYSSWFWNDTTKKNSYVLAGQTLFLNIYKNQDILDTYQHKFALFYPSLKSEIPLTKIDQCSRSIETPVVYNRKEEIELYNTELKLIYAYPANAINRYNIFFIDLDPQSTIYFEWKAFRVGLNSQTLHPDYQLSGEVASWRLLPFSWKHGLYIVRLVSSFVGLLKEKNYDQCYLKVVLRPLIASISGGIQKTVNPEYDLEMDPSGSQDPNQPSGREKLRFTLSCNVTQDVICRSVVKDSSFYGAGLVKPPFRYNHTFYKFKVDEEYNFTLKVESKDDDYILSSVITHQKVVFKSFPSSLPLKSFEIECLWNCDVKVSPQELVYLKLKGSLRIFKDHVSGFKWKVYNDESEVTNPEELMENKFDENWLSFIFIVSKNKLKENSKYRFEVFYNTPSITLLAAYELTTSKSTETKCEIDPTEGSSESLSKFTISCNSSDPIRYYEFYNKFEKDENIYLSGQMLAVKKIGKLENVILTNDRVEVHAFGEYGIKTITSIYLKLKKYSGKKLESLWSDIDMMGRTLNPNELYKCFVYIRYCADLRKNDQTLLRILEVINMFQIKTIADAKLCTSTLKNILVTVEEKNILLNFAEAYQAAVIVNTISRFLNRDNLQHKSYQITFDELYEIFSYLLDCIGAVLKAEESSGPEDLSDLRFLSQTEAIFKRVIDTLHRIGISLISMHLPNQKPASISSKMVEKSRTAKYEILIFTMVEAPYNENWFHWTPKSWLLDSQENSVLNKSGPVFIPDKLNSFLKDMGCYVGLQINLLYNNRALWWQREIKTEIVNVRLCYKQEADWECSYPQWLESPIWIGFNYFKLINETGYYSENVTRHDWLKPHDVLDLEMKVIKLVIQPRACLFVRFLLESSGDKLVVMIKKDIRPYYDSVENEGIAISNDSNTYFVECEAENAPSIYYMAILASEHILLNHTVKFSYQPFYRLCLSWNGKLRKWESKGSLVVNHGKNIGLQLTCQWSRLSMFAAEVGLVSAEVVHVQAEYLFHLTPWSNRTYFLRKLKVFTILFMVCLFLAKWTDCLQKIKRFVVILPDNFPREKFGYLICVKTGIRMHAGTEANIGFRLYGSKGYSRAHILPNDRHSVMQWLNEDWFLLFTHQHLGTIESLNIWHDNTGNSPAWFCDSILIFDMTKENYYTFIVNEWIALSDTNLPEAILIPVKLAALISWHKKFMDVLQAGFCQKHLWIATIFRHCRDPVTRTDRLMIILCYVFVSMSTSLCLVIFSEGGQYLESKEDLPYLVQWRDVVISFISLVFATAVAGLLMIMVRKSRQVWYCSKEEERVHLSHYSCKAAIFTVLKRSNILASESLTCISYRSKDLFTAHTSSPKQFITLMLMQYPLVPIQVPWRKSPITTKWKWRCTTIFVCLLLVLGNMSICVTGSDHLSPHRIERWIIVVVFTNVLHIMIYLPIKIFIVSFVLASALDRIIYKDFYVLDPKECRKVHLFGNARYLEMIIEERMEPKYQPLVESLREAHRLKRQRIAKWRMLMDLLFMLIFVLLLSQLLSWDNHLKYHSNSHIRSMMNLSRDMSVPSYYTLFNTTQFDKFLQEPFSLSLFKLLWYNMKPLSGDETKYYRQDWCFDNTYRMLGHPHFRQLRVKPDSCQYPLIMANVSGVLDCASSWEDPKAEDTRVYKPFWIPPEKLDNHSYWNLQFNYSDWSQSYSTNWSDSVNWSYTHIIDYTYHGLSGDMYPAAGYNRSLWSGVRVELSIQDDGWVEHHTRAILAQVTLYNVNTRHFTHVTLVTEQMVTGEYLTTVMVQSVDIIFYMNLWKGIFLWFIFMFVVRISMIMNQKGLVSYFKKGIRICEIVLLVTLISSIINLLLHYFTSLSGKCFKQMEFQKDCQINFYEISIFYSSGRLLLCLTFVLTLIYAYLSYFSKFGQNCLKFMCTMLFSSKAIFWTFMVFVLFLITLFNFICYLLSSFISVGIHANIFWKYSFLKITKEKKAFVLKILCFIVSFACLITTNIMVIIFIHAFRKAKRQTVDDKCKVNLLRFIVEEIRGVCKTKEDNELKTKEEIENDKSKYSDEIIIETEVKVIMADNFELDNIEPEDPPRQSLRISPTRQSSRISKLLGL